ncbi:HAD-IC family P-type ATPase, partial [Patescibacteria group bacterium]|nr:HAD-IC family P-type ATPase [Patescibacteria group bacterium]MBU1970333.1 HAD-IC family P-type ATPase [Patescibacteria group bacterium]
MTAQEEAGLSTQQAVERLKKYGVNELKSQKLTPLVIFLRQFKGNYLIYILLVCTLISFSLGERASSLYILLIILISSLLGFWNEYSAQKVVASLLKRITPKALVKRDDEVTELPIAQITVGDVVLFATGSVIPADLRLLQGEHLQVNESALTGESLPVNKQPDDYIYTGTNVESGHGVGVVVEVGSKTKYGKIATHLNFLKPETAFQAGLRSFGKLLVRIILILAAVIFLLNFGLGRPWLASLMFALAIAVGLTPDLLPVVVTLCLSHGAGRLAKKHVMVKQLVAVEDLGNMDILCCDKTGTLTEGKIELVQYLDLKGQKNHQVLEKAYLSCPKVPHTKHFLDPINQAVLERAQQQNVPKSLGTLQYLDTELFDYDKKAAFNLVHFEGENLLLVKGSYEAVTKMCAGEQSKLLEQKAAKLSRAGYRVLGLAEKILPQNQEQSTWADACQLTFTGILVFSDPPRDDAKKALEKLAKLNVELKVLTGDSETVTLKVCSQVGLLVKGVVLGDQLESMTEKKLEQTCLSANVFARMSPEQKLCVITTLQKLGHTVGFMGDGINDAPALHSADVGISVNSACDVAKQSAGVVLMRRGLGVVASGVTEGRKIFNNTIK